MTIWLCTFQIHVYTFIWPILVVTTRVWRSHIVTSINRWILLIKKLHHLALCSYHVCQCFCRAHSYLLPCTFQDGDLTDIYLSLRQCGGVLFCVTALRSVNTRFTDLLDEVKGHWRNRVRGHDRGCQRKELGPRLLQIMRMLNIIFIIVPITPYNNKRVT